MLMALSGDVPRTQNEQIESFRSQLPATQRSVSDALVQSTRGVRAVAGLARIAGSGTRRSAVLATRFRDDSTFCSRPTDADTAEERRAGTAVRSADQLEAGR
jgi:DNA recombination protein RmuC